MEARRHALTPPAYRDRLTTGIVHFGPGAFHRAHQADYVDRLLHRDPRWGIAAVSLRTAGTVESLKAQDGLYTLAILDRETRFRCIGAHTQLFGPGETASVRQQLLDPAVRLVTSTVTEKGYCLTGEGTLDPDHPDIAHDWACPDRPVSLIGWLALGLRDRRANDLPPFTPICCDNMASNGRKLGAAVIAFAERLDRDLARWIEGEVRFPNTMVDSIVPATDDRLRQRVLRETGFDDPVPVSRESFSQWVVEDSLPADAPDLASVGVTLSADVAEWERAKLRILNGAHSSLAYLGLLIGHDTVADTMADPLLSEFVMRMVAEDIIPTLEPSAIDLRAYAAETFERFRNPEIHHRLAQIAWDGSKKLPYRLLDTIDDALRLGRPLDRLAVPIAAWMLFIQRQSRAGAEIVDPLRDQLELIGRQPELVAEMLRLRQLFPDRLASDPSVRQAIEQAVGRMSDNGVGQELGRLATDG